MRPVSIPALDEPVTGKVVKDHADDLLPNDDVVTENCGSRCPLDVLDPASVGEGFAHYLVVSTPTDGGEQVRSKVTDWLVRKP